ncbi:MAG: hypothetical protein HRF50_04420 [Phycisphaerae bacterium]
MVSAVKTDNADPAAKLELRREYLRTYHASQPPAVFDCCQGGGLLWRTLRAEFEIGSYWGVDLKPKHGRLKIDSVRILEQPGWSFDVVDVDTYGSPWGHWAALLPHTMKPLTIFLTWGSAVFRACPSEALDAMGARFRRHRVAVTLGAAASELALDYLLDRARQAGRRITRCTEALAAGTARYFAVRLEP